MCPQDPAIFHNIVDFRTNVLLKEYSQVVVRHDWKQK